MEAEGKEVIEDLDPLELFLGHRTFFRISNETEQNS
jgi:hypothetical protein